MILNVEGKGKRQEQKLESTLRDPSEAKGCSAETTNAPVPLPAAAPPRTERGERQTSLRQQQAPEAAQEDSSLCLTAALWTLSLQSPTLNPNSTHLFCHQT